jgi:hypothetical protein
MFCVAVVVALRQPFLAQGDFSAGGAPESAPKFEGVASSWISQVAGRAGIASVVGMSEGPIFQQSCVIGAWECGGP